MTMAIRKILYLCLTSSSSPYENTKLPRRIISMFTEKGFFKSRKMKHDKNDENKLL
jgi:hypothetical protein